MEGEIDIVWDSNFFSSSPIWSYEVCTSSYGPYALRHAGQNIIGPHRKKSVSQNNVPEGGPRRGTWVRGQNGQKLTKIDRDKNFLAYFNHAESESAIENIIEAPVPKRKVIGDPRLQHGWASVDAPPAAARGFTAGGPKCTGLVLKAACGRVGPQKHWGRGHSDL